MGAFNGVCGSARIAVHKSRRASGAIELKMRNGSAYGGFIKNQMRSVRIVQYQYKTTFVSGGSSAK